MKRVLFSLIIILVFTLSINSATINVPADQPTIQAGIDASVNGDTVLVAAGTYNEIINFLGKSILLTSTHGAVSTILTYPTRCTTLISFVSGEDTCTILDGFTISNVSHYMGIVGFENSSGTVRNCVFEFNSNPVPQISSWGVIAQVGGYAIIENNIFRENSSNSAGGFGSACGQSLIHNNFFINNEVYGDYGGAISIGGSICRGTHIIINNLFINNSARHGGAVFISENDNTIISNNTFYNNSSSYNDGGGICVWYYNNGIIIEKNIFMNHTGYAITNQYGSNALFDCNNSFLNTPDNYLGAINQGVNSFSLDPLFCDTTNNNFTIRDISPCTSENNACSTLIGAYGVGCIYPIIDTIFILNEESLHVLNHTPEISWSFITPTTQTDFEIAVGTDNDWAFAEMWNPAPITSVDTFITYNGSTLIDGETYYGRLKVSNGTAWSDWFEFSFRMNSKPTTPITISPINDTLTNSIPTLWIQNSSDAEGDSLFYDFSGNKLMGTGLVFELLLVGNNIAEGIDSTSFSVLSSLAENSQYAWEVRAYDGYEYSDWTTLLASSFFVNDVNEAPSAPVTVTPNETSSPLYNMQPTFNWTESIDVDPFDTVHYKLHLAIDSNFTFETLIDLLPQNFYTLTFPLEYKENYWWKVEAVDLLGVSTVSNRLHFWTSCCIADRGNANGGSDDGTLAGSVTVADLVFLVAYMFQGGAEPACMDEADVNGSGGINISDLVSLVAYMFQGGASPAHCP